MICVGSCRVVHAGKVTKIQVRLFDYDQPNHIHIHRSPMKTPSEWIKLLNERQRTRKECIWAAVWEKDIAEIQRDAQSEKTVTNKHNENSKDQDRGVS